MSYQVYSVPGQTEGTSIDFSSKISLTCGVKVNLYRSVHHPIPTLSVEIGNTLATFKKISKLSSKLSFQVYSLYSQTKLEAARMGAALWDYPQEHFLVIKDKNVCPFVKFETILPLLCCLLDPFKNKHCTTWSSMINLWIDSRNCQKYRILLTARQRSNNYLELSKETFGGNMMLSHWPCFTWKLFIICFYKILKLMFQKHP